MTCAELDEIYHTAALEHYKATGSPLQYPIRGYLDNRRFQQLRNDPNLNMLYVSVPAADRHCLMFHNTPIFAVLTELELLDFIWGTQTKGAAQ